MSGVKLYDVLKAFYDDNKKTQLKQYGFDFQSQYSSGKLQTFFNPDDGILIFSVRGTDPRSLTDLQTDISLGLGRLKQTKRYKDADAMLKKAKQGLNPKKTVVTGFSLGGAIASGIASGSDKVYTFNRGSTIGSKTRANEESYRVKGDLVSENLSGAKTIPKDFTKTDLVSTALGSHELDQLKNDDVMIYY
jgi:hypothetical protein